MATARQRVLAAGLAATFSGCSFTVTGPASTVPGPAPPECDEYAGVRKTLDAFGVVFWTISAFTLTVLAVDPPCTDGDWFCIGPTEDEADEAAGLAVVSAGLAALHTYALVTASRKTRRCREAKLRFRQQHGFTEDSAATASAP